MKTISLPVDLRSFELLHANKRVLELMAGNRPLNEILDSIVGLIETFASGCLSTAYFVIDGKLRLGAAPSWPLSFVQVVEGCPIGLNQGTCGHAAATGTRSISTDVTVDEVWGPFRDWILSYGIKAAWSTPVLDENGEVIATVSMCWKEKRVPTEWDFQIVDAAASLMRIAVERKRQSDLIVDQQLRLVSSSRLAAIGEMAAGVAHEINNPLTVIRGHAGLLQLLADKEKIGPEHIRNAVSEIDKTVHRISGIIRGLKNLSRDGDHDPFESIELKALIDDTLSFCQERFRKSGVTLDLCLISANVKVECVPTQVSQALLNLLNNAFDAVKVLPQRWVRIDASCDDQTCLVKVTDSGTGIPLELREKIMSPFFTTKSAFHGTGLGLYLSRRIAEKHNGSLTLNLEEPQTCFELRIPLKRVIRKMAHADT